jgi:hypothetical protein
MRAARKTLKKKGGLFGLSSGPTRDPTANVFTASNGIQLSKSKTRGIQIYSTDGGKTWKYTPNSYSTYKPTPPDLTNAEVEYKTAKKQKRDALLDEYNRLTKTGIYSPKTPEEKEAHQKLMSNYDESRALYDKTQPILDKIKYIDEKFGGKKHKPRKTRRRRA